MAGKKRKQRSGVDPALERAAVVQHDGPEQEGTGDGASADLRPDGRPLVDIKLPKGALGPAPNKVAPPTSEEQMQLRDGDVEGLMHSNLLNMQLEALLDEVCVDYASRETKQLEAWLRELRAALVELPAGEPLVDGDNLPLHGAPDFTWSPPPRVVLGGAHLLRTHALPEQHLDLLLELPAACLRAKDHLDQRYVDVRLLYVHHLGVLLGTPQAAAAWEDAEPAVRARAEQSISRAASLCESVCVLPSASDGSCWPVLSVRPKGLPKAARHVTVRLIPFLAVGTFPLARLRPSRCNVRPARADGAAAAEPGSEAAPPPTALYNNRLLEEMAHVPALESLHAVFSHDARGTLRDAVILLKVWGRQRGFGERSVGSAASAAALGSAPLSEAGGVTPRLFTVLVACLVQRRVLTPSMSAYAAFRVTVHWLANADAQLDSGGARDALVLRPARKRGADGANGAGGGGGGASGFDEAAASALVDEMRAAGCHPFILLEPTTGCNLAASVSAGGLAELRHEARLATQLLRAAAPAEGEGEGEGEGEEEEEEEEGGGAAGRDAEHARPAASASAPPPAAPRAPRPERHLSVFRALFVQRLLPALKWDVQLRLTLPAAALQPPARAPPGSAHERALCAAPGTSGASARRAVLLDVETIAARAWGDRVELVRALAPALEPSAPARAAPEGRSVLLCAMVRHDHAVTTRQVDRGPTDAEEAAAYGDERAAAAARAAVDDWGRFWGARSELRRFRDGQVVHAVVWPPAAEDGVYERLGVLARIAEYALRRHVRGADRAGVRVQWPLGSVLAPLGAHGADGGRGALGEAARAFDRLASALRQLREMPLAVLDVKPAAAALRYAAEPPPTPLADGAAPPAGTEPIRFVLVLEGSGRWPAELEAVDALRAALHVRIVERLRAAPDELFGGSPPLALSAARAHFDVLIGGFALRGSVTFDEHVAVAARAGAAHAVAAELVGTPVLSAALRQLALTHPAYSPCARLLKRWAARHLLSGQLPDCLLELLAAHAFARADGSCAYAPPRTATVALLRALHTLGTHAWGEGALHVPLREEGAAHALGRARALPRALRAAAAAAVAPPLVRVAIPELCGAAGGFDVGLLASTDAAAGAAAGAQPGAAARPSRVVARRLIRLAASTLGQLLALGGLADAEGAGSAAAAPLGVTDGPRPPPNGGALPASAAAIVSVAFSPAVHEFDVLLHLSKAAARELAARGGAGLSGFKNLDMVSACPDWPARLGEPRVPALVRALEAAFDSLALFCYDRLEGKAIAVRWRPAAFMPRPFKPAEAHLMLPLPAHEEGGAALMVPNVAEVLAEMLALGRGVLTRAELIR